MYATSVAGMPSRAGIGNTAKTLPGQKPTESAYAISWPLVSRRLMRPRVIPTCPAVLMVKSFANSPASAAYVSPPNPSEAVAVPLMCRPALSISAPLGNTSRADAVVPRGVVTG